MEDNIYDRKSVNSLILYFSVPAVLSLIVEIMASVVDTAFAGHLGPMAVDALTAMGLITPILNLFTAIQALFAVSTSIFIARYLNQKERRDEFLLTGMVMSLVISTVVSGVAYIALDSILNALGAEGAVYDLAASYLKIQLLSNIFSAMGYTLTSSIRAFGNPKVEMVITGSSVIVNIIFNAVLVFGFNMGIRGLAYGTLASEVICLVFSWVWLSRHHLLPKCHGIRGGRFAICSLELAKLGLAQTAIQALGGCTGFFVNNSLIINAGDSYVAVWNVVQNIYTLLLMPTVGISQGVETIIAYYGGQGKNDEKRKAIGSTMVLTVLYGLIASLGIFLFGDRLLSLFVEAPAFLELAGNVLRIIFATFPLMGVFYTVMTLMEVTEHEVQSVLMILTRQVFLMVPLVYLLPRFFSGFQYAIFMSVPIADFLSSALSIAILAMSRKCR